MTKRIQRHEQGLPSFVRRGEGEVDTGDLPPVVPLTKGDGILIRSTTILAVLRDGQLAFGGDGQVSLGNTIMKAQAVKIRTLRDGKVLTGFAGSTADALTLFEKFEGQLDKYNGNITRAAVELAKEWRTDRILRRLEALLLVGDKTKILTISGNGDVVESDDGIAAIGSGGCYALASARALIRKSKLSAKEVVEESMKIASEICVFTNEKVTIQTL